MAVKTYGKSNDNIPEAELITAKLIATAKSRGLRAIRHNYYEKQGNKIVGCCAIGAARLYSHQLRNKLENSYPGVVAGNDALIYGALAVEPPGYVIGESFYDAVNS